MRHFVLLLAVVSACTVGEVKLPGGDDGAGGVDAPPGGGENPRLKCADRGQLSTAHEHTLNNPAGSPAGPRSGLGCMTAGTCHGPGGGGGEYAFAGTAYKEVGGTTAQATAIVRMFKENPTGVFAQVAVTVTDSAGNFFIAGTYNDFPYISEITACGADAAATPVAGIRPMVSKITTGQGNCNSGAGCHAVPGPMAVWLAD